MKVWDASRGACMQTLTGHSSDVSSVAFSHDSTKLASASYDNTVKVWDASSGTCLQTFTGHSNYVRSVAFSHGSTKLASASGDSTVKVWDASSGACLQTFTGHSDYVRSVAFSHDSTNSCLHAEIGTIVIHSSETSSIAPIAEPGRPLYLSTSLSSDNAWIKHDGKNMLWVPSEYRPSCSSTCGTMVGIGVGTGRVWTCSIDLAHARICS